MCIDLKLENSSADHFPQVFYYHVSKFSQKQILRDQISKDD